MVKDIREAVDIINTAAKEGRVVLTTEEGGQRNHIWMQDNGHHILLTVMKKYYK